MILIGTIQKAESPDYQIRIGSLGFLLLQRYIFCRVLDIRVTKLVEATNGHSLVEAENAICYDIVRGYGLRRSLFG